MAKEPKKLIANNKKVYHDYFLLEKYEAGISLAGTEVKSLRMGKGSIKESFIRIENGEIILYGMHITPYEKGNIFNKDPLRPKKLLLHKKEIEKLSSKMKEKGFTIVPVEVYFKGSLVKVEIALAKGKKLYDKRADIAKKDQKGISPSPSVPRITASFSSLISCGSSILKESSVNASAAVLYPSAFRLSIAWTGQISFLSHLRSLSS